MRDIKKSFVDASQTFKKKIILRKIVLNSVGNDLSLFRPLLSMSAALQIL